MTKRGLEIFRTETDWVRWDKHIQYIDVIDELTDEQKKRAKQSLQYLRKPDVLGESFLVNARNEGHLLFEYFNDTVPWKRKWATRFAEAMKSLRDADGFSESIRKVLLNEPPKFSEKESVLELAYKFFNVGFNVSFDRPAIVYKPRGHSRQRRLPFTTYPDLKIVDKETGEEIFVEVSDLSPGDLREKSRRTFNTIFSLFRYACFKGYLLNAKIQRILDEEELKDAYARSKEFIDRVISSGASDETNIEGKIEMCLAPRNDDARVSQWAAERNIKHLPIEGAPIPTYDIVRTKNAIRRKAQEQLPTNKPGIVIITHDHTLLFFTDHPELIISEIEGVLQEFPHLLGAVVTHSYQSGEEEGYICKKGQHILIKRTTEEDIIERTIVVLNEARNLLVSSSTIERAHNAFIKG